MKKLIRGIVDFRKNVRSDYRETFARLALTGRPQDVQLLVHRAIKRYRAVFPEMTDSLTALMRWLSPLLLDILRR